MMSSGTCDVIVTSRVMSQKSKVTSYLSGVTKQKVSSGTVPLHVEGEWGLSQRPSQVTSRTSEMTSHASNVTSWDWDPGAIPMHLEGKWGLSEGPSERTRRLSDDIIVTSQRAKDMGV